MKNLSDEILRHLYDNYNDFSPHNINDFLRTYQPTPTSDEIRKSISAYERQSPKLLYSDGQYKDLGTHNSMSLTSELRTIDNTNIEVSLTTDGKKYWEEKLSREQPQIIHRTVSVGDISGGQVVVDSTTRDITYNPITNPTIKHIETHTHKLNKRSLSEKLNEYWWLFAIGVASLIVGTIILHEMKII